MQNKPTRIDRSLPEQINSLREMINRRDIQFERIRDELVIEMKELIKGIELLEEVIGKELLAQDLDSHKILN
jgi:hypothetical protein|tara:strand:- start:3684 stop:3899 length:216 start_codon:yes stop_codon:yes gene_type:complete